MVVTKISIEHEFFFIIVKSTTQDLNVFFKNILFYFILFLKIKIRNACGAVFFLMDFLM
jgi:hypothetical protein